MNPISTLIKNLIIPIVVKHSSVDVFSISDSKWEQFGSNFINFETDASTTYSFLYQLELDNPENIFKQLPEAYNTFISQLTKEYSQLAEEYVLGNSTEITDALIATKNEVFLQNISFFKTMKAVITKNERQRLKNDLPIMHDRLVYELDEKTVEAVAKKRGREDLKKKFKQWDSELAYQEANTLEETFSKNSTLVGLSNTTKTKQKVFQLSWIKYAAAASVVFALGFWFYNNQNSTSISGPLSESLAEVSTVTKSIDVIANKGLGYASENETITVIENQQQDRIQSMDKAIETYQTRLEQDFPDQESSSIMTQLKNRIDSLQTELEILKGREKQYSFDSNTLNIYISQPNTSYNVVTLDSLHYLNRDKQLYFLKKSKNLTDYIIVKDSLIIEQIDEILFKNGLPTLNE